MLGTALPFTILYTVLSTNSTFIKPNSRTGSAEDEEVGDGIDDGLEVAVAVEVAVAGGVGAIGT